MTMLAIETTRQAVLVIDLPHSSEIPSDREDRIEIATRTLSTVVKMATDFGKLQISAYGYDCHLNGLFVRFFSTANDRENCDRFVDHLYSAFYIKRADEIEYRKVNDLKGDLWRIVPAPDYVPK